jgi:protein-tyrosine phosphatase
MTDKIASVLFVCLGNICRSPTAEAVFRTKAAQRSLELQIDSAGTQGYHTGAPPDKRSQQVASIRGYNFKGLKCRRVSEQDFDKFDYIVAMDIDNVSQLKALCPEPLQHKIRLFMSFCDSPDEEVPDPYYGGQKGFELVLNMIEQAADGLLDTIVMSR